MRRLSLAATLALGLLACLPLSPAQAGRVVVMPDRLPLAFEPNRGQAPAAVKFVTRGDGYRLSFTPRGVALGLFGPSRRRAALRMSLVGTPATAKPTGENRLPGQVNYLIGHDRAHWRTHIPTYARVGYSQVYPGVDLHFYGNARQLEYDFAVSPHASPKQIRLSFAGAKTMRIKADGGLALGLSGGSVCWQKPYLYQMDGCKRRPVSGRYVSRGPHQIGFQIGRYDPSKTLVIDPVLAYSTYLGGTGDDAGEAVAVDSQGCAYVAGYTSSTDFPGAAGTAPASGNDTAFVSKLSADGSHLIYSTYYGGTGNDFAYGIAVDGTGAAYLTGATSSTDLPMTSGAFQTVAGGGGNNDAFVAKFSPDGSALLYSSYLGGDYDDLGYGLALDGPGVVCITGYTTSDNFPATVGAYQTALGSDGTDAFVAKVDTTKNGAASLVYATYLGGPLDENGAAIAVDGAGSVFVAGQKGANGQNDAFVAKLDPTGATLIFDRTFGDSQDNGGATGVAVDGAGSAYITGYTHSASFPTTAGAFQPASVGPGDGSVADAFLLKLSADGGTILYSTYLSGSGDDTASGITVDQFGNAYVVGQTDSTDFPTTPDAAHLHNAGLSDAFVAKIDTTQSGATSLVYSTFLGGSDADQARGIAIDGASNALITGATLSIDFPTLGAAQPGSGGSGDAFVFELSGLVNVGRFDLTALTLSPGNILGGTTGVGVVTLNGPAPVGGTTITLASANSVLASVPATVFVPANATSARFPISTATVDLAATVGLTAQLGSTICPATLTVHPLSVSVSLNPTTVVGGSATTGTVTLSDPAPAGASVTVGLSGSDSTAAGVPDSVTVPSGSTTATFSVSAKPVASSKTVTITASIGNAAGTATLTVQSPTPTVLTVTPNTIPGGTGTTGTLTLNGPAPADGLAVPLTSSNPTVTVPATVTIPQDALTANFALASTPVSAPTPVTITAGADGVSAVLTVLPPSVLTLSIDPGSILGGGTVTATITLSSPAPSGGAVVTLSGSNSAVTVPASVTVPSGASRATVTLPTQPVGKATNVTLTAALSGVNQTASVTLLPAGLAGLSLTPTSVVSGQAATGTVTIQGPAPAGGTAVSLSSDNTNTVSVPATVTVPAGASSANFTVQSGAVRTDSTATVTASLSGVSKTAVLAVTALPVPPVKLKSVTTAPGTVSSGGTALGTVTLSAAAPARGTVVGLSANSGSAVTLPATISIPAGASSGTFTLSTASVTAITTVTVTASLNAVTQTAQIVINPVAQAHLSAGLQMISLPEDYSGISPDQIFGAKGVTLAVWVPALLQYALTPSPPADAVRLGRGYWVRLHQDTTVTQIGKAADPTQDFAISLVSGWNQIGEPFKVSRDVASLRVVSSGQTYSWSDASGGKVNAVSAVVWGYTPGGNSYTQANSLATGQGYWVHANSAVTLLVPAPNAK